MKKILSLLCFLCEERKECEFYMINLLIIDKNLKTAINLINLLSENSHDIKVTYVTDNLSDGINILNTNIIDITVIHTDEKIELISNALHKINDLYYEKYKKSIILIAENICNDFSNHYIYENFNSFKNISVILSEINELAKNKLSHLNNSILLRKINRELDYIGYNLSHIGTKYLSECIALIYNNYNYGDNLNKTVYSIIAKKYHKNVNNIKCNITSATNSMFYECDENRLKNYFNFYTDCKQKPKLVIYTIINKLK